MYGKSDDPNAAAEGPAAAEDETGVVLPYDSTDPEMALAVIDIVDPYYESSKMVAINSPEEGRAYTDHKIEHALICTEKTLEAGQAIRESVLQGGLETEAAEGKITVCKNVAKMWHEGRLTGSFLTNTIKPEYQ